jgi:hypothetical protein
MEGEWEDREITEDEVKAFADKLSEWAKSLPPEEQALLGLVLDRAQAAGEEVDVKGYEFPSITGITTEILNPMIGQPASYFNPIETGRWKLWKRGVSDFSGGAPGGLPGGPRDR